MLEQLSLRLTPLFFVAVLAAAALVVAWGGAVIAISLATIGLYALVPAPALIDLHDQAGQMGVLAVALVAGAVMLRRALRPV